MRRPVFHSLIIALVVFSAAYAGFMPNRASSRASSLINPAEGLSYSGVVADSQNTAVGQSLKNSVGNPLGAPAARGDLGSTSSLGRAGLTSQAEVLSAGLQAPNLLSPLTLTASECDTSQSDKYCVYTVQEGDNLSSIASNAGLKSTEDVANWELLVHSNRPDIVSEDDILQPGQKLRIPRGQGAVHTVLSSETLSDLADQFEVAIEDILQANGISDADALAIGDELLIPNPKRFASPVVIEESPGASAESSGPQIVGGGPRSNVGFIWPVGGPISSFFGPRHPLGIDIDLFGSGGAPIASVKSGTVKFAGGNPCCSYGYYVVVDHGDGYQTLYAHLSGIAVAQGQSVSQGQLIGYGGSTGYSTGTHLHFEVHRNGSIVNPLNYLP